MLFERQQYQQDCVDNIVSALSGVDFAEANFQPLADNLRQLQARPKNAAIRGYPIVGDSRLDVLMETGTGKTFVYLQTILELNKRYGQKKFIVVLPRTAIKQGVVQNIKLTESHFAQWYKKRLKYINFPQEDPNLKRVHQDFIKGDDLSILLITNSAFNSKTNNINKASETLFKHKHKTTWEGIAKQNPTVIIDEPHLLMGEQTQEWLGALNQSLFIRFGATFPTEEERRLSNVVYSLDSIDAFNQYLVKGIGVSTVYPGNWKNDVAVANVRSQEKRFDFCYNQNGQPRRVTVRPHEDIEAKSGVSEYRGVFATKIKEKKVFFNKRPPIETKIGYTLGEGEIRLMLREAIGLHFAKEERLFKQGLKALTLSFIPHRSDFRGNDPKIKKIFEEEYRNLWKIFHKKSKDKKYRAYLESDFSPDGALLVHEGYFSGDNEGRSESEREQKAIDAILKDKEALLSLKMPLRFIFSVWALQEGWDNPNIFTICKLAPSSMDTSRRQQVGRGLRLAVNQTGRRMTHNYLKGDNEKFKEINTVDVVVSGQEQTFIHEIQNEINATSLPEIGDVISLGALEYAGLKSEEVMSIYPVLKKAGVIGEKSKILSSIYGFLVNNPDKFPEIDEERYREICEIFNPQKRIKVRDNNAIIPTVRVRKRQWEKFKRLWEEINREAKIVYRKINEEELIEKISNDFNREPVDKLEARVVREKLDTQDNRVNVMKETPIDADGSLKFSGMARIALDFMREEQKELPAGFICKLFGQIKQKSFENDEAKAKKILRKAIEDNVHKNVLQQVDYVFDETKFPNSLQDEKRKVINEIEHTKLGKHLADGVAPPNFLYDKVAYDSEIERRCVQEEPLELKNEEITVFAKLPPISVPTPYKNYNPDFAYLIKQPGRNVMFLIVETKGFDRELEISADDLKKIEYGRKFFDKLRVVLRRHKVDVHYETRANDVRIAQLLQRIRPSKGSE